MSVLYSSTLPQASQAQIVGVAKWGGESHFISVGGRNGGTIYKTARAFHPDGTFTDLPDRPDAKMLADDFVNGATTADACTLANGDVVFVSGYDDDNDLVWLCQRFVAATQTWAAFPPLEPPDVFPSGTVYWPFALADGRIVCFPEEPFTVLPDGLSVGWIWSPATNAWTRISFPLFDINVDSAQGCILSDGRVLAVGTASNLASVQWSIFDGTSWSAPVLLSTASGTNQGVATLGGGKAIALFAPLIGGSFSGAWLFDGASWTSTNVPTTFRGNCPFIGSCAGEAYIVGGTTGTSTQTDSIEKYSVGPGTWSAFDALPHAGFGSTGLIECTGDGASQLWLAGGREEPSMVTDNKVYAYSVTNTCTCDVPPTPPPTGTCLVFDMRTPAANPASGAAATSEADQFGQWYQWNMPAPGASAALHKGLYRWLDTAGKVRTETEHQYFDDTSTPILPVVAVAPLSLAQLQNAERIYRVQVNGESDSASTQTVIVNLADGSYSTPNVWSVSITTPSQLEFRPSPSRVTSIEVIIQEIFVSALNRGFRIKSFGFEVGASGRMRRLPASLIAGG